MTLLELAERCEKATGPDRELDLAIARASYGHGFPIFGERVNYDPALWLERYGPITASLDAAMTLVPEGMVWFVEAYPGDHSEAAVRWPYYDADERRAATPALALCAAALKARAAQIVPNTPEGDG
jgi:hypothetical protein